MSDGSTKIKNGLNLQPVSADPNNPAEGDLQFSDGTARAKGLWQYSNGNWAEIGGGGQGGINYLAGDNSDAENGIGDWVTYADAAGENAVDGTGGTALGVTLTQNTTDPLRETADFKFSKDAADRQGEGASVDFTIDNADKAQKLTISFDYDASNANYADDDIRIAIYDVTNSNLIRVNGEDLKGGKGTHLAQFQTAADSTSYRLIIHQSSTNATAYDVYLDNISVGPREVVKGAVMTDFRPYDVQLLGQTTDPTINGTPNAQWRRVGDSMEIKLSFQQSSAGTAGSGIYAWSLPDGYKIDFDKVDSGGATSQGNLGSLSFRVGTINGDGVVLAHDFGTKEGLSMYVDYTTVGSSYISNGFLSTANATWRISFTASVPIQGWSSNAVTSEDLGGREVVVRGSGNNGQAISANIEDIVFEIVEDTTNSWGSGDTLFTTPETGNYIFRGSVDITALTSFSLDMYVDGSKAYRMKASGTATRSPMDFTHVVYLTKGQTVGIRSSANVTLSNTSSEHYLHIQKLASPQSQLETETVAARYTSDAGATLPTVDNTTFFIFEDLDYDTHNAYDTSTGEYTVPVSGKYLITTTGLTNTPATYASGNLLKHALYINNTKKSERIRRVTATNSTRYSVGLTDIVDLEKGDVLKIDFIKTGTAVSTNPDGTTNYFSITRIK